jgi:sulfite exporter TauE/SafE
MYLLAAISLGFLGSFHCIGMCGPIALAIPVQRTSRLSIVLSIFTYNSGRLITYSIMGLLFGLAGQGFALAGWQNMLSIILGVSILVFLFFPAKINVSAGKPVMNLMVGVKNNIGRLFKSPTKKSLLVIGMLNGLLPCGLVYLGIAGSIATGSAWKGALFMAGFGLGTFPAMMTLNFMRSYITPTFRNNIRRSVPFFAGIMAVLLIVRGMNLNIPYLSPGMNTKNGIVKHECCHK